MKITRLETDLLRVPLPRPVSLPASQDPRSATTVDLLLVRVHTDGGESGLGFTYAVGGGGAALRAIVEEHVAPVVVGDDPGKTEWLFVKACAELEGVGFAGLAARAYAAVDFALWDLKGRLAKMPVYRLLGGYRTKLKAIVADTATPAVGAKRAAKETRAALDRGAAGVAVELGTEDPDVDADRVRQIREAVPEGVWFEINGCGRYDFATALSLGRMLDDEFGLDGFSDPLRPDDWTELARLVDRMDGSLAVGGLYDRPSDFLRLLEKGGVSAVRIDPVRLGGLTPARKVAIAAELRNVAVYPVKLPEVGAHLACGVVWGRVCEYVDWFEGVFSGGPHFESGQLVVPDGPGFGLTLVEAEAAKYRV